MKLTAAAAWITLSAEEEVDGKMIGRDFFDDDLADQPAADTRAGDLAGPEGGSGEIESAQIGRLVARRQRMNEEVARAAEELERLRLRQEELERERRQILEIQRKQESYVSGRNELLGKLTQRIVSLEREEVRASQLAELLGDTRRRFKELLEELGKIDEESWEEDSIREELDTALAIIEDVRMEYNRSISRIEAARGESGMSSGPSPAEPVLQAAVSGGLEPLSFGRVVKLGFAFCLPVLGGIFLLGLVFIILRYFGMV